MTSEESETIAQKGSNEVEQKEKSPKGFLVYYSLSSSTLVQAEGKESACDQAFAALHNVVGKIWANGITSAEAAEVRLGDAEVEIDSIEELPPGNGETTPNRGESSRKEFFEITSLARADLEDLGFDTSQVDDATMEHLAHKMADDYVERLALIIIAELQGIPRRPGHKATH